MMFLICCYAPIDLTALSQRPYIRETVHATLNLKLSRNCLSLLQGMYQPIQGDSYDCRLQCHLVPVISAAKISIRSHRNLVGVHGLCNSRIQ